MSDLYLRPTDNGAEIIVVNRDARTTNALEVAVFLSLFAEQTCADMSLSSRERYISRIPSIMGSRTVTNQTRVAVINAAKDALAWMTDDGIATDVEIDATIASARRIDLSVIITQPEGGQALTYALNWDAQAVELLEAT